MFNYSGKEKNNNVDSYRVSKETTVLSNAALA